MLSSRSHITRIHVGAGVRIVLRMVVHSPHNEALHSTISFDSCAVVIHTSRAFIKGGCGEGC